MNAKLSVLAPLLVSLAACAQVPAESAHAPVKPPVASQAPAKLAQPEPKGAAAVPSSDNEPEKAAAPGESALTGPLLYEFLLGEIAGQRGDLKLSAEAYADLAHKTRDVRVVRRAAEIAIYARDMAKAADMAALWVELEPQSVQARQLYAASLIGLGRFDEAKPQLEALLSMEGRSVGEAFLQVHGLLARSKDRLAALGLIKDLAAEYPLVPEAHLAVAQSELAVGQTAQALAELDEALRLRPDSEQIALLKGQLLSTQGGESALTFWKGFLAQHPDATHVRLAYARELTKAGRFEDARGEFETLLANAPESPELHLAVGLLSMQMNDLAGAEKYFEKALALGYPDQGLVEMYLGQVSEGRQRYDQALDWYRKVTTGEHAFQARLKEALVLGELKRVDEALALLEQLKTVDDTEKVRVVQTEAQVLREAGRYQEAYDVLSAALAKSPDVGDLIYDRAMIEDKLDRLADMEADLRRLIKLEPGSANAYNALGYTLVDRTDRIDEGIALLDKALKLSPNDPFILDSMGWAQYKAGRLSEAVDYLRRAYRGQADPEIAAHLGEVLWQKGEQDEARRVWQEAEKAHPDNELLRKTLSRFGQ
jgi:tetratricopeptide (TPR) repeat protein